jgi:3-deoxy-manno-octulosonate cytidylyltransferase (CMP-KDO synthetase)
MNDVKDKSSCKIVSDLTDHMLYCSRNKIPIQKNGRSLPLKEYKKHIGIFFFSKKFLHKNKNLWDEQKTPLAEAEGLEQIRFLEKGVNVKLFEIDHRYYGIDSEIQLQRLLIRYKFLEQGIIEL